MPEMVGDRLHRNGRELITPEKVGNCATNGRNLIAPEMVRIELRLKGYEIDCSIDGRNCRNGRNPTRQKLWESNYSMNSRNSFGQEWWESNCASEGRK